MNSRNYRRVQLIADGDNSEPSNNIITGWGFFIIEIRFEIRAIYPGFAATFTNTLPKPNLFHFIFQIEAFIFFSGSFPPRDLHLSLFLARDLSSDSFFVFRLTSEI